MDEPVWYQIKVKGHLNETMKGWFDGFSISNLASGDALICGYLVDQAALHGLLNRISGLGFTLISVNATAGCDEI